MTKKVYDVKKQWYAIYNEVKYGKATKQTYKKRTHKKLEQEILC